LPEQDYFKTILNPVQKYVTVHRQSLSTSYQNKFLSSKVTTKHTD